MNNIDKRWSDSVNEIENLRIKSIFNQIRKERDNQSIGEKEICIECLDRIEKKFLSITK